MCIYNSNKIIALGWQSGQKQAYRVVARTGTVARTSPILAGRGLMLHTANMSPWVSTVGGWIGPSINLKPNDYFTLFSLHLRFCAIFDHSRISLWNKNIKIPGTYLGYPVSTNATNKFSIQSQVWFAISTYLKPEMVTL